MLKLYDYPRSSAAYRLRIALHLKALPHEATLVHLLNNGGEQHAPGFRAVNPQGLVPALETPDGILTQSLAIIEYLDECYPSPPLLPAGAAHRARVRAMALTLAADTHPIQNLRVLQYLRGELKQSDTVANAWARHWVQIGLTAFQDLVNQAPVQGTYSYGSNVTLADIVLVPQLVNARRFGCDLAPLVRLTTIEAALLRLPAFAETAAKT
jgi:maleylpyruvate isomerase